MIPKMNFQNEHLTRQMDLIPTEVLGEQITIIGAGAIGSWVTLSLAKMGFSNITVFDHDVVDLENMNSQFFGFNDIGHQKVHCLGARVQEMTGIELRMVPERYVRGAFKGIVVSAVDSMRVRKTLWSEQRASGVRLLIDARMGSESALLFSMNPNSTDDIEAYETSLYEDKDAVQERCTSKATAYTALMLSGLVCKAVKDALVTPEKRLRIVQWSIKDNDFVGWTTKSFIL